MKNRIIKIGILSIEMILFYLFIIIKIEPTCIFKKYLNIRCPGCGLTRAFKRILEGDFLSAIKYNILSIPLFIILIIISALIIYDIIYNAKKTNALLVCIKNNYIFIIILLIITIVINNISGI